MFKLFSSLDSSSGSAATPGQTPNSPGTSGSPRASKHTPTVGGASIIGVDGSPDEWVFPRLVDATPPEVAKAVQMDSESSSRPLLEQEKWILSKIFQSSAHTKCSEEVVNPKMCESGLLSPKDFFDVSVRNYVLSPFCASVGMPSGIGATPTGDNGAAHDGNNSEAPSRDRKAERDSIKEEGRSSNSSKEPNSSAERVSIKEEGCSSNSSKELNSSASSSAGGSSSSSGGSSGRRGTGLVPGSHRVAASGIPRVTK